MSNNERLDFGMIKGGVAVDALSQALPYFTCYLSDETDAPAQCLAAHFIEFHQKMLNVPHMRGYVEPDGSSANLQALYLAREKTGRKKVLCTNVSHSSVNDACKKLQLELLQIDVNPKNLRISNEQVTQVIGKHSSDIAAVISTYGTTPFGHIEALEELACVKEVLNQGAWLHIDAAYGGVIGSLSSHVKSKVPAAQATTLTVDNYKFLGTQGSSLLFIDTAKADDPEHPLYCQSPYTFRTSMQAGNVAIWHFSKEELGGYRALEELADDCVRIARNAGDLLQESGVPLFTPPVMGIVPVQLASAQQMQDMHTQLLQEGYSVGKIHLKGKGYESFGVRMVVTPKVNTNLIEASSKDLVKKMIKIYHSF